MIVFWKYGVYVSQLLLTNLDFVDCKRKLILKNLLDKLVSLNLVPIINENDSISTDEITFGDNDILSVQVSELFNADLLIILSNVDGLYRDVETKDVVSFVDNINSTVYGVISSVKSDFGTGGMQSKIIAAQVAAKSNIMTVVSNINRDCVIKEILNGDDVGTLFSLSVK
ncbi:MAG: hypothetical protein K0B02_00075 [DPANN group archaeon]|nr:hypothetical protein [DPANN group archaeon]